MSRPAEPSPGRVEACADPLDREALDRLKALDRPGRPSVYAKVLRQYMSLVEESLSSLHHALEVGNAVSLKEGAHRLKSSSAQVGALGMAAVCQQLETIGGGGTVDGAAPLCDQLRVRYQLVAERLQRELARLSGGNS